MRTTTTCLVAMIGEVVAAKVVVTGEATRIGEKVGGVGVVLRLNMETLGVKAAVAAAAEKRGSGKAEAVEARVVEVAAKVVGEGLGGGH
jgi:hypothetical protein